MSAAAYPNTTSVGASGGIMGLIGFLLATSGARLLPPGFAAGILVSIAATAALGLIGFAVIDNEAHFGGLVAGALLGGALGRYGMIFPAESARSELCGHLAFAVIAASAVVAALAMGF